MRGYHPLLAVRAGMDEVLHQRLRGGSAATGRGAASFTVETIGRVRRAGATGQITLRADSGFYMHGVVDACSRGGVRFSISARSQAPSRNSDAYASLAASARTGRNLLRAIAAGTVTVSGTGRGNVIARAQIAVRHLADAPAGVAELAHYAFDPDAASSEPDAEKQRWLRTDLESLLREAIDLAAAGRTFSDLVDSLRYRVATRMPLSAPPTARVRIMTLHSAKGLQADRVVVAGAAGQIIPGLPYQDPAVDAAHRAEQRRLLYVAITRAKVELVVSWPQSVSYSDARAAYIAIDNGTVFTDPTGERRVRTGRTSLLPSDVPSVRPGPEWLAERGASYATDVDDISPGRPSVHKPTPNRTS